MAQTLVRNRSLLIQRDQPLDRTAHCAVMSAWGAVMSSWRKDCVLLVQRELVRLWSSVPTPRTLCLLVFGHVCLVMALGGSSWWTAIACCPAHLGSVSPCQWSVFSLPGQEGQWRSLLDGRPGLARPLLVSFCPSHPSPPGLPRQYMAEGSLSREVA